MTKLHLLIFLKKSKNLLSRCDINKSYDKIYLWKILQEQYQHQLYLLLHFYMIIQLKQKQYFQEIVLDHYIQEWEIQLQIY